MRPRGEIRTALASAARALLATRMAVTYREIAEAAMVGFQAARATIKEMVRAKELKPVGSQQVPGTRRPLRTYTLAAPAGPRHGEQLCLAFDFWPSLP